MKQVALGLALLTLPYWLPAGGNEALASGQKPVVLVRPEGGGSWVADQNAGGNVVLVSSKDDDGQQHGWLGVSIEGVPEALAAQLNLDDGRGLMVLNVVTDSPAEKAGLRAHDIIVSVNGVAVENDANKLREIIGGYKPGDVVQVEVMQDGNRKTVPITLGSRPATFEWKFEVAPDAKVDERVRTRGRIMTRDPSGKWLMKDLGDLHNIPGLPEDIRVLVQGDGNISKQIHVENNEVKVRVNKDGETIVVERSGDGPITVERVDQNGKSSSATYNTEEELEAADAEAYELFSQVGDNVFRLNMDGSDRDLFMQLHPLGEDLGEWQAQFEVSLREAREAFERAREEIEAAKEQMARQWDIQIAPPGTAGTPGAMGRFSFLGKPRQSFTVQPNGQIEVRIRKGDSEVVRVFSNEDDLAARDPELFEKYQDTLDEE